jgi:hypothetical protein
MKWLEAILQKNDILVFVCDKMALRRMHAKKNP